MASSLRRCQFDGASDTNHLPKLLVSHPKRFIEAISPVLLSQIHLSSESTIDTMPGRLTLDWFLYWDAQCDRG